MKLLYAIIFISSPLFVTAQQIHPERESASNLTDIEFVRDNQMTDIPSFIKFKDDSNISIAKLKTWMISNIRFDSNMGFKLIRSEIDNIGHTHYRYQQTYFGKPIEDAIWIAHTAGGKVYSLNGMIYSKLTTPTSNSLDENTALTHALSHIGATTYKWEIAGEEQHLKWESEDAEATYFPKGELVFIPTETDFSAASYRLAYKFNIYAHAPLYRAEVYVDANSGEVIRENMQIHHADEPGTAHAAYSGEQDIIADSFDGEYRLRDGSRGDGVRTFDLNQSTDFGSSTDFIDDDNDWNNINPQLDEYATDAHWGAEATYDYFFDIHGRNSLDNAGFQLNSYVHYGVDFYNAFWDGSRMTYGDGDGGGITPLTTLDIAGHEVTHGLTSNTADLIYSMESGALNESFSDIFGSAIERFARPDDWDWLLGIEIGEAFRNIADPNDKEHPDTYFGDYWADLDGWDSGGVHTNSGVQNYWFYLLTEGGTGTNDNDDDYTVTSAGVDAASAIAFRNLTVYLTPSSQFEDARFYAIQSAIDLYGACSFEVEQTTNAWYAVGVGPEYEPFVFASFTADETEGCELPFTVNFENESINGIDFLWDFGDGGASTDPTPSHTYTTAGDFTVTLAVDGDDCGDDDTSAVSFIIVDTELDCPVIFPGTGTGDQITACQGLLYDSGGASENYGASENAEITIAPDGAGSIELNFLEFDVEDNPTCAWDWLSIYDGPDDGAPLIDKYCNSNIPTTITSTGGEITLVFHSDGLAQGTGFKMEWSCTIVDDTGIPEEQAKAISIYPNPAHDAFTIDTKTLTEGTIEISDILGRRIMTLPITGSLTEIDLPKYNAAGIYMVNIKNEKGMSIKIERVVVN
ncbi:MAG: bacillolysin [Crocinitomix sp.]|jgi:bacillolysin